MEKAEPEINEEAIPGMEVVETTSSEHAGDADHAGENNDEPSDEQSEADEQEEPEIQPSQASKALSFLKRTTTGMQTTCTMKWPLIFGSLLQ